MPQPLSVSPRADAMHRDHSGKNSDPVHCPSPVSNTPSTKRSLRMFKARIQSRHVQSRVPPPSYHPCETSCSKLLPPPRLLCARFALLYRTSINVPLIQHLTTVLLKPVPKCPPLLSKCPNLSPLLVAVMQISSPTRRLRLHPITYPASAVQSTPQVNAIRARPLY